MQFLRSYRRPGYDKIESSFGRLFCWNYELRCAGTKLSVGIFRLSVIYALSKSSSNIFITDAQT